MSSITGSTGSDSLAGTTGNDSIYGLAGDDTILAGAGDDSLDGGAGNDTLAGGSGNDTAYFSGNYSDYLVSFVDSLGAYRVEDTYAADGDDGVDYLTGIESIAFGDTVLTGLSTPPSVTGGSIHVPSGTGGNWFVTDPGTTSTVVYAVLDEDGLPAAENAWVTLDPVTGAQVRIVDSATGEYEYDPGSFTGEQSIDFAVSYDDTLHISTVDVSVGGYQTAPDPVSSSSGVWGGSTADFTFTGDEAEISTANKTIFSNQVFSGDFSFKFKTTGSTGTADNVSFGAYLASDHDNGTPYDMESQHGGSSTGYAWHFSNVWAVQNAGPGSGTQYLSLGGGSTDTESFSVGSGEEIELRRDSGEFTYWVNGVKKYTWGSTNTDEVRLFLGSGGSSNYTDISWQDLEPEDSLLSAGNDEVVAGSEDNVIDGLAGDDKLVGAAGNDTIDGGAGEDLLIGSEGNDALSGETGNDTLAGGSGNDTAYFSGDYSDYLVSFVDSLGAYRVEDTYAADGDDGVDYLTGIESIAFGDTVLTGLSTPPSVTGGSIHVPSGTGGNWFVTDPGTTSTVVYAVLDEDGLPVAENAWVTLDPVTGAQVRIVDSATGEYEYDPGSFTGEQSIDFAVSYDDTLHISTVDVSVGGYQTTPDPVSSSSGVWGGSTADFTFTGDEAEILTANKTIFSNQVFSGDFSFKFKTTGSTGTADNVSFGAYLASDHDDGTSYDMESQHGGSSTGYAWHFSNVWAVQNAGPGSGTQYLSLGSNNTHTESFSVGSGEEIELRRDSGEFTYWVNGVKKYTWGSTNTDEVRLFLGSGGSSTYTDISWQDLEPVDPVLSAGNDEVVAGSEDNIIDGLDGDDKLDGGAGSDIIVGGGGDDWLIGGDGVDTVDYSGETGGVTIDLSSGSASGATSGQDSLSTFENVVGSAQDDTIKGNSDENFILAGEGNDTIYAEEGMDVVGFSGESADYDIYYDAVTDAYIVTDTNISDGDDGTDIVYGAERFSFSDGVETASPLEAIDSSMAVPPGETIVWYLTGNSGGLDDLTFSLEAGSSVGVWYSLASGARVRLLDDETGKVEYDPQSYTGQDSFGFSVTAGSYSSSATVDVGVDAIPAIDEVASTGSGWGGSTADFTFTGDDAEISTANKTIFSNQVFSGDFSFKFKITGSTGTADNVSFGAYLESNHDDETTNDMESQHGNYSHGRAWYFSDVWAVQNAGPGSGTQYLSLGGGSTHTESFSVGSGEEIELRRDSGKFSYWVNGVEKYTWDSTNTDEVRLFLGSGGSSTYTDISWQDFTDATAGNDAIILGDGNSLFDGLAGSDLIDGRDGDDTLSGNDGSDSLLGGAGNDSLFGGNGGDTLSGGSGADLLNGGSGFDLADYSGATSDVTVDLSVGTAVGGADIGTDSLVSIEGIIGSAGNDTLTGSSSDNFIFGFDGDDILSGGSGDDILAGGEGNDSLDGGAGSLDFASYQELTTGVTVDLSSGTATGSEAGTDQLTGIEGVIGSQSGDTITAGTGGDSIIGGSGDDTLTGNSSDDVIGDGARWKTAIGNASGWSSQGITLSAIDLNGDPGTVTYSANGIGVAGGSPVGPQINLEESGRRETLIVEFDEPVYEANVVFSNLVKNEEGGERGHWEAFDENGVRVDFGDFGPDQVVDGVGVGGLLIVPNAPFVEIRFTALPTKDESDNVPGALGDNDSSDFFIRRIEFTHGDSGSGNDVMSGAAGDDELAGGYGDDTLSGGSGNDTLEGGFGDDIMTGGSGNDAFVFDFNSGNDTITDFSTSDDVLILRSGVNIDSLTNSDVNSDTLIDTVVTFDDGSEVTLLGVNTSDENDLI